MISNQRILMVKQDITTNGSDTTAILVDVAKASFRTQEPLVDCSLHSSKCWIVSH